SRGYGASHRNADRAGRSRRCCTLWQGLPPEQPEESVRPARAFADRRERGWRGRFRRRPMNRNVRRWRPRSRVACGLVAAFPGCHEEVSWGGWSDVPGTLSTTGLGGTSTTDTVATATTTVATSIGGTGGVASTGTVGVSGAAGEATEPP